MNNIDLQYQKLLQDILDNGVEKKDRTGTGTISVFGRQIRHKMSEGFPLLTTKKMAWKSVVTELLWFLNGNTNIKYLVDNGCHIWDGDAYKNYVKNFTPPICPPNLDVQPDYYEPMSKEMFIHGIKNNIEFAKKWGELGPIYGKQWRNWKQFIPYNVTEDNCKVAVKLTDQISDLIDELKTNPDSRRLMVNAWNVGELDQMVLPPCHYGFQVYTRELSIYERAKIYAEKNNTEVKIDTANDHTALHIHYTTNNIPTRAISLMWNQRSVDTFLGLPFNIASYGLLLEIIAKIVNMVPDELIGNLGDVHLYSNHIEQAKEQIGRELTLQERVELYGIEKINRTDKGYYEHSYAKLKVDDAKIPTRTREPYPLPKLVLPKTDAFWNGFDVSLFEHLDPTDFIIKNYQSHPTIKAPLSN